jgi:N-carbamoyl-L-amino-acid hydrolase
MVQPNRAPVSGLGGAAIAERALARHGVRNADAVTSVERFERAFGRLASIGRDPGTGGYSRLAWTDADRSAREWFTAAAAERGLAAETDRNGNLWAWWGPAGGSAVVLGSHLDTVPSGGAYDGALGVVSGFLALDALMAAGVRPRRPVAVVAFADEEGARFGLPTFGSRLMTGALDPAVALRRTDVDGVELAQALGWFEVDPAGLGSDPERVGRIGHFLELHVEQGRALVDLSAPIGLATGIWPHGRWRLTLCGEPNHAGTTRLADRCDPMLPLARAIEVARGLAAAAASGAVATVGRVLVQPNGTNAVPATVTAWLDARAAEDGALDWLVRDWSEEVRRTAAAEGVDVEVIEESRSALVTFDVGLTDRLAAVLTARGLPAPRLPTAAGHDAGALAAVVPAAMIFVRNPTGVSHSPAELAGPADCAIGVEVLAAAVEELACR